MWLSAKLYKDGIKAKDHKASCDNFKEWFQPFFKKEVSIREQQMAEE